jgi:hypothetical protein
MDDELMGLTDDEDVPDEKLPAGPGRALGCMVSFAGLLATALGYGYTINFIPAPLFGIPFIILGAYFFICPRSRLVQRTLENMQGRR